MPMIDLTYPAGALTDEARQTLADELTTALLRAERAPETQFFRDITWVLVHELPEGHVIRAGRPVSEPIVRMEVTTPEGALSDRRRAELVAAATERLCAAFGIPEDQALQRVWVVCREIAEGSWGAGGQVVRFQWLRDAAAAERAGDGAAV